MRFDFFAPRAYPVAGCVISTAVWKLYTVGTLTGSSTSTVVSAHKGSFSYKSIFFSQNLAYIVPQTLFKLEDLCFQINIVVMQQLVRGIICY